MENKKMLIGIIIFIITIISVTMNSFNHINSLNSKPISDDEIIGGSDSKAHIYMPGTLFQTSGSFNINKSYMSKVLENTIGGADGPKSIFIAPSLKSKNKKNIVYIDTDDNMVVQSLESGRYIKKIKLDSSFYENPMFSPNNDKVMLKNKGNIIIYDIKKDEIKNIKNDDFLV